MAYICLDGLSFRYPGCDRPALREVSLSVGEGAFVVLCGETGSGKTTLLRLLKRPVAPAGIREGRVTVLGKPDTELSEREAVCGIGMVFQDPEAQLVTERVDAELAFALENTGCPAPEMRRRIGEMAGFFGLEKLLPRPVHTLSGGEKQLVNLCAVMLLRPKLLLLDEPIAQLDPIGAQEFLRMTRRLNSEWGVTVILCEHRLEEVFPPADRVVWMEGGAVALDGTPGEVCRGLHGRSRAFIPAPAALFIKTEKNARAEMPGEIRRLRAWADGYRWTVTPPPPRPSGSAAALSAKGISYRYEKNLPDVVDGASLELPRGRITALLGGNGAGKTTLLRLCGGLYRPQRGRIKLSGRAAYLPQQVQALFVSETVRGELSRVSAGTEGFEELLERHPMDLSGGQRQKLALRCLLAGKPDMLLLDEPTRALDPQSRAELGKLLLDLSNSGVTVLMATHDMEFAAGYADDCCFMFGGQPSTPLPAREFFAQNFFYSTAVGRILRDKTEPPALLAEDVHGE